MGKLHRFLCLLLLGFYPLFSWANGSSISMPGDTKLVVFNYDPNDAYTLYTRPGAVTDIELSPGETVQALALGDTIQWVVEQVQGHIFIKPIRGGLFTSATLVTSQRTYQLILRSSKSGGTWFQRVSWYYPRMVLFEQRTAQATAQAENLAKAKASRSKQQQVLVSSLDPSILNFDYNIQGKADFRPRQVFDNGTFTWILMGNHVQEMPALFEIRNDGKTSLLNYTMAGNYIKVPRLMPKMLLKLDESEVVITNNHLYKPRSLSGWFKHKGWGRSW